MCSDHLKHDEASLRMHELAVELMRRDAAAVERARATVLRWMRQSPQSRTQPLWQAWVEILESEDWAAALAPTDRGQQLRQASPLATLLTDEQRAEARKKAPRG